MGITCFCLLTHWSSWQQKEKAANKTAAGAEKVSFHGSETVFPAVMLTFLQVELCCEVGPCLTEQLYVLQQDADVPVQDDLSDETNTTQTEQVRLTSNSSHSKKTHKQTRTAIRCN